MSINNSYFSKNNTIISNKLTNTGRNPVTELFLGSMHFSYLMGINDLLFDLDLTLLKEKVTNGTISLDCNEKPKHTLRMVNTSSFDRELLNTRTSQGDRMKAFNIV